MRLILVLFFSLFVSCSHRSFMNSENYYAISVGTTVLKLEQMAGKPYQVKTLSNGEIEYTYIQRIPRSKNDVDQRHYIITIKDGIVVDKRYETFYSPIEFYISR